MNVELKAMLDLIFDSEAVVEKIVAKQSIFSLIPAMFTIVSADVPAVIKNWSDILPEIEALPADPAKEADLVAYVEAKFKGVLTNAKAQAILSIVLKLIMDALALEQAIVA